MGAPDSMTIRPARLDEADSLRALTGRSALHWGYEPKFLEWEPEAIAMTPAFLAQAITFVLEESASVIGYYALIGVPPTLSLD